MRRWIANKGNTIGVAGLLGLLVIAVFWRQHEITILASGPLNGSFQLYNPLWRVSQGQSPGSDFLYFHGFGTLYAHYPVFAALGSDLSACLISKRVVSVLGYLAVFFMAAKAWRIPWPLAAVSALACALLEGAITGGSLFLPGNSLLGTRTILPVLAIPLCLWLARGIQVIRSPLVFHTLLASLLGLACFVSTEQGIAAIIATTATLTFFPYRSEEKFGIRIFWPFFILIVSVSSLIFFLIALTGPEWKTALNYLFSDVPNNQFWYFGGPPNDIPDYPGALTRLPIIGPIAITLALLILEIFRALRKPPGDENRWISISLMVALASGLISQVAHLGSLSNYHEILVRNAGLASLVWMIRIWRNQSDMRVAWFGSALKRIKPALLWPATLAPIGAGALLLSNTASDDREKLQSPVKHGGVTLSKAYADELQTWNQLAFKDAKVASTYTSLIEDVTGRRFGGPDYLIHALGSQRPVYQENLEKFDPDFFFTLNPSLTYYEEWLQLRHWDLYQSLVKDYHPVALSYFHVFWRKMEKPRIAADPSVDMRQEGDAWISPPNTGAPAVYTVRIEYEITNPADKVPFIGKLTRHFARRDAANPANEVTAEYIPAPLPPDQTRWEFPLLLNTAEQARITPEIRMDCMNSTIHWKSVSIRKTSADPAILQALVPPSGPAAN